MTVHHAGRRPIQEIDATRMLDATAFDAARVFAGNRPTTTILAERLTHATLGALVALTSTASSRRAPSGTSTLAQKIVPELESAAEPALAHDSSTNALLRRYRKQRKGRL